MSPRIVTLSSRLEPDVSSPPADRLLEGQPEQRVWNYFTDATQQFFAGRWSSTRGKWRVRYTESELCVITAGKVLLIGDDGTRNIFQTGDAFVVPAGYSGSWEVIEDCVKIYAIFEAQRLT